MIKKLILLIITLASFQLAGEERSLSAIELLHAKFYEKKYSEVKAELVSLNKKELTPPEGIPTPDGGHYNLHKFLWNSKDGVECILMLFVVPDFNIVDDVGISGNSYKIVDDPDNSIRERRRIEHENVCIAG
jgi:hypothetical protein